MNIKEIPTRRQKQVIRLIADGLTSKEMAETLQVSKRTVDFHVGNIYAKFKCRNRVQLVVIAAQRGLL